MKSIAGSNVGRGYFRFFRSGGSACLPYHPVVHYKFTRQASHGNAAQLVFPSDLFE